MVVTQNRIDEIIVDIPSPEPHAEKWEKTIHSQETKGSRAALSSAPP